MRPGDATSVTETEERSARFATALMELEAELDWRLLGDLYCHGDGADFFAPEQLEAQREAGLRLASGLGDELREGSGASLYVGAAVGELVLLLCEAVVLERRVVAVNLPGAEADELNRGLARVEERTGLALCRITTDGLDGLRPEFDHIWMTSVLTDPDSFPALHDRLYERTGEEAVGGGNFAEESQRAQELVSRVVRLATPPARFSTTDEELEFVARACEERDWTLGVPDTARLSAIVGDAVRTCRITKR